MILVKKTIISHKNRVQLTKHSQSKLQKTKWFQTIEPGKNPAKNMVLLQSVCLLEQITIIYRKLYKYYFFLEKNSLNFTIYVWWDLVSQFFRIRLKHFGRNFQF